MYHNVFIAGFIPHRASLHSSCVGYDGWRACVYKLRKLFKCDQKPRFVWCISISGIHIFLFVLVFDERRTNESLGKKIYIRLMLWLIRVSSKVQCSREAQTTRKGALSTKPFQLLICFGFVGRYLFVLRLLYQLEFG